MNTQISGYLGDIAGYLPTASGLIDFALLGALGLCVLHVRRTGHAIRTLQKVQEDTPNQIQTLIANLETVRTSVSNTLSDVTATITEFNESASRVDVLKDDVSHVIERLQRHLIKAQETLEEVTQVTASAERIADRIAEVTSQAKQAIAPRNDAADHEDGVIEDDEEVESPDYSLADYAREASDEADTAVAEEAPAAAALSTVAEVVPAIAPAEFVEASPVSATVAIAEETPAPAPVTAAEEAPASATAPEPANPLAAEVRSATAWVLEMVPLGGARSPRATYASHTADGSRA